MPQSHVTYFLSLCSKEVLKVVLVPLFHSVTMNGDWSFQALKRAKKQYKIKMEVAHMTCALCSQVFEAIKLKSLFSDSFPIQWAVNYLKTREMYLSDWWNQINWLNEITILQSTQNVNGVNIMNTLRKAGADVETFSG